MNKRGHYQGPKHKGNHTTLIPVAEQLVKKAERLQKVTGISPGFIDGKAKSTQPRLKFKQLPAGLQVTAIGKTGVQTIFLYTIYPKEVEQALLE